MLALPFKAALGIILVLVSAAMAQDDTLSPPQDLPQHVGNPPRDQLRLRKWCGAFCSGPVEKATLHSITRRADTSYIVFSTVELRDEQHIHWVAIRGEAVIGYQRHYLESPRRPISGSISGWKHGILFWTAEGMFLHRGQLVDEGYSAFFDPQAPDKGFQIKETYKLPRK